MRNPLHRKKLQLALTAFSTKAVEKSSELDYIWVAREALSYCFFLELCKLEIPVSVFSCSI